jgi:ATP-dependent protease ClpP protease subunit
MDPDDEISSAKDQLDVMVESSLSNVYTVPIDEDIGDPSRYRNLLSALATATERDIFKFRVTSRGGQLGTGLIIANAIMNSAASTLAVIEYEAVSAASLITMACDEIFAMPNSYMMVHTASYGTGVQQAQQIKDSVDFYTEHIDTIVRQHYEGFLSEEEIEQVIRGKEIFLHADEINKRVALRNEYFQTQQPEEENEE